MTLPAIPDSRLRALLSDCTRCLTQQMYFWGRDVIYPEGNLLCEYGFERNESQGLQGTSCYRKPWREGYIELHGACAGWYSHGTDTNESFVFIRPFNRVYRYVGQSAPIPGEWNGNDLRRGNPQRIFDAALTFLKWWAQYEHWIDRRTASGYREECYRIYRKLPASPNWLPPQESLEWLERFLTDPANTNRALRRHP